jgi:hypothetical protein
LFGDIVHGALMCGEDAMFACTLTLIYLSLTLHIIHL